MYKANGNKVFKRVAVGSNVWTQIREFETPTKALAFAVRCNHMV